jgi:phenylacetate-CoA ligase
LTGQDPAAPDYGRHRHLLTTLLAMTKQHVPYYRQKWREAGIDVANFDPARDFQQLPIVHKADLRRFAVEERLDQRFKPEDLKMLSTSGSTGVPFQVFVDPASLRRRQLRTMRGLWYSGYRPGQQFLWLKRLPTDRITRPSLLRRIARLSFINVLLDPATVLEQYYSTRPSVLYGQLSALVMVAEGVEVERRPSPSIIVGFGEQLTPSIRDLVRARLGAEITDFYGNTEVGLIAVNRPGEDSYRMLQPDVLYEYLPSDDVAGYERLIVTNMRGGAMPFIRYDTGDLVKRDHSRPDRPIVAIGGTQIDFLTMRSGQRIGPHLVDNAIYKIPGLKQYKVVQQADHSIDLYMSTTGERAAADVEREATTAMGSLCGPGMELRLSDLPESQGASALKLHVIRSLVTPTQP